MMLKNDKLDNSMLVLMEKTFVTEVETKNGWGGCGLVRAHFDWDLFREMK
jgi:hypothetical protein